MNTKQLERIRAMAEAATPGPWNAKSQRISAEDCWWIESSDGDKTVIFDCSTVDFEGGGTPPSDSDTAFIIAARTDIPVLIAEIEQLQAENERLRRIYAELKQAYDLALVNAATLHEQLTQRAAALEMAAEENYGLVQTRSNDLARLSNTQELANNLAALVARFVAGIKAIRPQVGNGVGAALDEMMRGVDVPEQPMETGTLGEVIQHRLERLFEDVAGMTGFDTSPLELFRAQQTMVSAWWRYVNDEDSQLVKEHAEELARADVNRDWAICWKRLARQYRRMATDIFRAYTEADDVNG